MSCFWPGSAYTLRAREAPAASAAPAALAGVLRAAGVDAFLADEDDDDDDDDLEADDFFDELVLGAAFDALLDVGC